MLRSLRVECHTLETAGDLSSKRSDSLPQDQEALHWARRDLSPQEFDVGEPFT